MDTESYADRRERLLRSFYESFNRVKPLLDSWLGEKVAKQLFHESRSEYDALIPRIPFIGRSNPLLVFFLPTPQYLAVYRGLQRLGYGLEAAGYITFEIGSGALRAIPYLTRKIIGYVWFLSWFKARIRRRAEDSHLRKYPGNFVLNYVEGYGQKFDYGVDYVECANCKFLEAERAFELAPYICAIDKTASELLGWGLSRTMTLADGYPKCDFRFKKGRETSIALPLSLQLGLALNESDITNWHPDG